MNEFKNKKLRRLAMILMVFYVVMGCMVPLTSGRYFAQAGNVILGSALVGLWVVSVILFFIITIFA